MIWIVLLIIAIIFCVLGCFAVFEKEKYGLGVTSILLGVSILVSGTYISPRYNVWAQGLYGQAELARAEQNKQIRIQSAKAQRDAAVYEAEAEVARARGVAEANKIIADGLGGAEGYLRWRYIEMLQETGGNGRETIYIPTEAGIPILEAGRMVNVER